MTLGSKPWNRSKLMFVGEGRVGKTALCNNIMGRPFVETDSTVGLTQLTCNVRRAAATGDGTWAEHMKPEREYEAGLAQLMESLKQVAHESALSCDDDIKLAARTNTMSGSVSQHEGELQSPVEDNHITFFNTNISLQPSVTEPTRFLNVHVAPPDPDEELVMRYLADVKVTESNMILSLFDFGGQSVFNIIHHLFLTSYGVYVVVFRMDDIIDNNKRELSITNLSFWINSIVIHSRDVKTGKGASMFLVGTHKDKVRSHTKHKYISNLIKERFEYHIGWPSIQEYNELCFFPVNNRVNHSSNNCLIKLFRPFIKFNRRDNVILDLLRRIENLVRDAEYTLAPRPLTWLKALDEFVATKKSFLTLIEASSIAIANGVEKVAVPGFLLFLNEMGVVLWLDEPGLRDVVILDIIRFFVEPVTLIICNHISTPSDGTVHHKNIQVACRKNFPEAWNQMVSKGIIGLDLMNVLLRHHVQTCNIPVVIDMMLKYGLIVRLEQTEDRVCEVSELPSQLLDNYLVPALLPRAECDVSTFQDDIWKHVQHFDSCYFVFSSKTELNNLFLIRPRHDCFLPKGLMERLIGKVVKWSQRTHVSSIHATTRLYQNYAVLSYGRRRFRLVCNPKISCIRLDIEGEHPLPVHDRIYDQICICVKECMGSLQFMTTLRFGTAKESEEGFTLLNLRAIREVYLTGVPLTVAGYAPISRHDVRCKYGLWLNHTDILPSYDAFISRTWPSDDDELIYLFYDSLLGHSVDSDNRAIQVFFDKGGSKESRKFQRAFGKGLINSTIFIPILCASTLRNLLADNPAEEDSILIECILALECIQDPTHAKVRGIYPLLFGLRKPDGSLGDLFDEGTIESLPDVIPTVSIEVVRKILEDLGIKASSALSNRTVRNVVNDVSKHVGLKAWEYPKGFIRAASENIVKTISDMSNMNSAVIAVYTGEYKGVLEYLRGYVPPKSCLVHMLEELPGALPGVAHLHDIVVQSEIIASTLSNPHGLTTDEVLAVVAYTSDSGLGKESNLYYHINSSLRMRKNEVLDMLRPYLTYFMSAMAKLPPINDTVYRGVTIDGELREEIKKYAVGTKVHWSAFTSTSTDVASALQFKDGNRSLLIFELKVVNGRNLSEYSIFPDESEVLLSPNARFVVYDSYYVVAEGVNFTKTEHSNMIIIKMVEPKDGTLVF